MDWLIEIHTDLERGVFWQVATLLDLKVDLLFFDTTSTYFERDTADEPILRDSRGRGRRGAGGVSHLRQVEGPPRGPAADRDRDGGHPDRSSGAGVVLAG
jgi:hypothetical protein